MARGASGRIVLEIDPAEKLELYVALTRDGLTLKSWFLREATRYLSEAHQRKLFVAEASDTYLVGEERRKRPLIDLDE